MTCKTCTKVRETAKSVAKAAASLLGLPKRKPGARTKLAKARARMKG